MLAFVMDFAHLKSTRTRVAKVSQNSTASGLRRRPRTASAKIVPVSRNASDDATAERTSATSAAAGGVVAGCTESGDIGERDWSRGMERGAHGRMRVIFVGHNPSDRSWAARAPYAHPSNSFWRLLREAELAPPELCVPDRYVDYPKKLGIAFADLFVTSGSLASAVAAPKDPVWRTRDFCARIARESGELPPAIIACVSKGVAQKLLPGWAGTYGPAGTGAQWGLTGLEESHLWVLPTSSGRAGIKWELRLRPFSELAAILREKYPCPPLDDKATKAPEE